MCDLTIAKEIQKQLFGFGKIKVMSWGACNWKGGENFLQFKVNGYKLAGAVRIELNGKDLYDITFYNEKKEVVQTANDIYFDQMVDLIDGVVETTNGKYS